MFSPIFIDIKSTLLSLLSQRAVQFSTFPLSFSRLSGTPSFGARGVVSSPWSDGGRGTASSTCILPNHNIWVSLFHLPSIEKCTPCRQYPQSPHKNAVPSFHPCVAVTHPGPTSSFRNGRVFRRHEIDQGVVSFVRATHYCSTLTYVIPKDRELTELDDKLLIQLSMQTNSFANLNYVCE